MKKFAIWICSVLIVMYSIVPVAATPVRVRESVEKGRFVTESYDGGMSLLGALPERFDLRDVDGVSYVGEIRNQGITNSCWAFSALSCTESFLRRKAYEETGALVDYDFSERHMEHASYPNMADGVNPYAILDRSVNTGGNVISAAGYFQNGLGPVAETDMPFSWETAVLSRSEIQKTPVARVRGMRYFPRLETSIFDYNYLDSIASIKEEIYTNGGVAAVMNMNSGTFNEDETAYYSKAVTQTANHAITLIGWDDTYSRENFGADKPSKDGAWLVRNSTGENRHDAGYFYLSYANVDSYNMCSSVTDAENAVSYDRVYGTTSGTWGYGSGYENNENTAYAANVYEKQAATEYLTEVSIDIRGYTEYEIYVVADSAELSLDKAVLAARGTENYMGFTTVTLPEPVSLTGTEFAIIVKYKTPGYTYSVPVHILPYCPEISKGVSFLSPNGVSWEDTAEAEEAVGIFGYTVNSTPQSEVTFAKEETTYVSVFDEAERRIRLQADGKAILNGGIYRYVAENAALGVAEGTFSVDGVSPYAVEITGYVKQPVSDLPYVKAEMVSYRANIIPPAYASIPYAKGKAQSVEVTYDGIPVEVTDTGTALQVANTFLVPLIEQGEEFAELTVTFYDDENQKICSNNVTILFTKTAFTNVYVPIRNAIINPTESVTEEYAVNLISANLAVGGEVQVRAFDVTYPTERENGYLVCDILVLDAVSGRYFRIQHSGEVLRVTQEVTLSGGYYRVNVRNNVNGIKTVNLLAEYDETGRMLSVTAKNVAAVTSSFLYPDNGNRVKIFTLLKNDMITPCTEVYTGETE